MHVCILRDRSVTPFWLQVSGILAQKGSSPLDYASLPILGISVQVLNSAQNQQQRCRNRTVFRGVKVTSRYFKRVWQTSMGRQGQDKAISFDVKDQMFGLDMNRGLQQWNLVCNCNWTSGISSSQEWSVLEQGSSCNFPVTSGKSNKMNWIVSSLVCEWVALICNHA